MCICQQDNFVTSHSPETRLFQAMTILRENLTCLDFTLLRIFVTNFFVEIFRPRFFQGIYIYIIRIRSTCVVSRTRDQRKWFDSNQQG